MHVARVSASLRQGITTLTSMSEASSNSISSLKAFDAAVSNINPIDLFMSFGR
jgi:hypothetical protein